MTDKPGTDLAAAPVRSRVHPGWRVAQGAALLLALAAAGFAAGEATGWRVAAAPAARWLSQSLGLPVTLAHAEAGDFELSLWRGIRLQARSLRIDSAPGFDEAPLFAAEGLVVTARWRDWLRRSAGDPWPLERLTADRLESRLIQRADGGRNWVAPGRTVRPAAAASAPRDLPVRVALVAAGDGRVHWTDDIRQADVKVQFNWRPSAPDTPQGLTAVAEGQFRNQAVSGRLQTDALGPWLAGSVADGAGLGFQLALEVGRVNLDLDGRLTDPLGERRVGGRYRLSGPSLAAVGEPLGVTLPTTAAFNLTGAVQGQGLRWSTDVTEARVGRSRLAGTFHYDGAARPRPSLQGRLTGRELWLEDLGPAIGTPGAVRALGEAPAVARKDGKVLPDARFDLPSLRAMDADVAVDLARVEFGSPQLQAMAPLQGRVALNDGQLRLSGLKAGLAQGRLEGQVALDGRTDQAQWQTDLTLRGVRLEQWVKAVQREGQAPYAGGRIDAQLRLTGQGRSTAELLASADGRLALQWTDGQISHLLVEAAGLDIAQGLGVLLKGDDALPVRCGVADVQLRNGRATPQGFVIDTRDSRLWLQGSASLAEESLALQVRVQPKDWTLISLRAPVNIGGRFASPSVSLDRRALMTRAVPAALLAMVHPLAALLPLFDAGESDQAQGAAARACPALVADLRRAAGPAGPGLRAP